jgi:hypothetical protein
MRRLSLTLLLALGAVACGHVTPLRPAAKGAIEVEGSLGGPLARVGGLTIPVPLTTVSARYGFSRACDISGSLHLTSAAFGVAGLDVGTTGLLLEQSGAVPTVSATGRLYAFSDLQTAVRPFVELSAVGSYKLGQRWHPYLSVSTLVQLFGVPLWNVGVGGQVDLGRWALQLEARWYRPELPTNFVVVDWVNIGGLGAAGVVLGARYRFGGEG